MQGQVEQARDDQADDAHHHERPHRRKAALGHIEHRAGNMREQEFGRANAPGSRQMPRRHRARQAEICRAPIPSCLSKPRTFICLNAAPKSVPPEA